MIGYFFKNLIYLTSIFSYNNRLNIWFNTCLSGRIGYENRIEVVDIHFWILHILFTLGIIGGLLYKISTILQGGLQEFGEEKQVSRWHKFWYFVGKFFKNFFSKKFIPIIKVLIFDVILHSKLFKENKLKWLAHTCLFWGILVLFILSVLSGIAVEVAPALGYKPGVSEFMDGLANKDNWVTAVLNELLNVVILIGVIIAFIRGFVSKKKIGMMLFQDIFLIIFIIVILITGWFTEATRYIIENTPGYIAKVGFLGYYLSRLMQFLFLAQPLRRWIVMCIKFSGISMYLLYGCLLFIYLLVNSHMQYSVLSQA